eukprot:7189134-Prymnesium_polylepis.1
MAGRMAAQRAAGRGGQPVSIVQNISGDLLDGEAEPHHLTDAAARRPGGSLDDDEKRAAGAGA